MLLVRVAKKLVRPARGAGARSVAGQRCCPACGAPAGEAAIVRRGGNVDWPCSRADAGRGPVRLVVYIADADVHGIGNRPRNKVEGYRRRNAARRQRESSHELLLVAG